ncbi:MAG: hypothetical protein K0B87_00565 [Candidatus Syntrophosphaera sp.]|nr:hypothetical protein [Candidatus Syntrophosphaera sp.]
MAARFEKTGTQITQITQIKESADNEEKMMLRINGGTRKSAEIERKNTEKNGRGGVIIILTGMSSLSIRSLIHFFLCLLRVPNLLKNLRNLRNLRETPSFSSRSAFAFRRLHA